MSPQLRHALESATVDVPTAAAVLGVSDWLLYKAIRAGESPVPVVKVGRKIRIPTAPLRELLGVGS